MITRTLYERIQPILWQHRHSLDRSKETRCPYCPDDMCAEICRVCGKICFAEYREDV